VNYNVKHHLERCLISIEKACQNITAEIFVVDNASTDGSEVFFKGRFNNVNFIWGKKNVGFAKANNSVLNKIKGEYILFLNPDTLIPEDCLDICIDFFSTNTDCGAVGVRMVDGNGFFLKESKRGFPSPTTSFYKMFALHRIFKNSKIFSKYYEGHLPENKTNSVDVLSGAFMILSNEALKKVIGFDEDYFMYGEDIDLCYRISQAGFKKYYLPTTTIVHLKGASTEKSNSNYSRHFYGAMKIFVRKHYSRNYLLKPFLLTGIELAFWISTIKRYFIRSHKIHA